MQDKKDYMQDKKDYVIICAGQEIRAVRILLMVRGLTADLSRQITPSLIELKLIYVHQPLHLRMAAIFSYISAHGSTMLMSWDLTSTLQTQIYMAEFILDGCVP